MGFTVDLSAFREFAAELASENLEPLKDGMVEATAEYTAEMGNRFDTEGDGTWAPLAKTTIEQRKHLGFGPEHIILVRYGILQDALVRGNTGNVFEQIGFNIVTGIGGDDLHPGYGKGASEVPIGVIAYAQHHGVQETNLPERPILVQPSDETLGAMKSRIVSGLIESIQQLRG